MLFVIWSLLAAYYVYFLLSIAKGLSAIKKPLKKNEFQNSASIIIPFRNESNNILKILESIERQNYPKNKFEAIFVNDNSTDDSLDKLNAAHKSSNIKIVSAPQSHSKKGHKKRAIIYGLQFAKGEVIVSADADCIFGTEWLSTMLSMFAEKVGFVSGPVEFIEEKGIFNKMQRLEFAGLIIIGAGLIGIGKPSLCNAANLAYRRKAYDEVGGYGDNLNISSGDDMFLMQKIALHTNYTVAFCADKKAIARTSANLNLKQFYSQRKRWASKSLFYFDKIFILKIIFIFLFYLGLFAQLLAGIFISPRYFYSFGISILLKAVCEYFVLFKGSKILFDKSILKSFLITEALHAPYVLITGIAGAFGKFEWKERKVKR